MQKRWLIPQIIIAAIAWSAYFWIIFGVLL
jgi:hypothetical protein